MTDTIPEIVVHTVTELVAAVPGITKDFGGHGDTWWRGHSRWQPSHPVGPKGHWQLVPGVYRDGKNRTYEHNAVAQFVTRAPARYPACPPALSVSTAPDWLFLMQHYGVPTRLLDWTKSPLIAAFFAVSEHQDDADAVVWALNPFTLNLANAGYAGILMPFGDMKPAIGALFVHPFNREMAPTEKVVAVAAKEIDMRMLVQLAAFTIHGTETPLETVPSANSFLRRLVIPAAAKKSMHEQLEVLGLRHSTLFPDLQSLAQELKTRLFTVL